jgi:hypothetical protein
MKFPRELMISILKIKKYTYIRDVLSSKLKFPDIKYFPHYIQYNEMIKKSITNDTIVYFVSSKKQKGSIMNFCIV